MTSIISVFFAGLWPLVWHYGTGVGIIIIAVAVWWFSPLETIKKAAAIVAIITGAGLFGMTIGVKDANSRCNARWEASEKAAVSRSEAARSRAIRDTTRGLRNWRDPQNKDKP